MSTTIEQLELSIESTSDSAVKGIEALSASLTTLKGAVKGGIGLTTVTNQVNKLSSATKSLDEASVTKLDKLTQSLARLHSLGNVKISSSIANQIHKLGEAAKPLNSTSFEGMDRLTHSLKELSSLEKSKGLTSALRQLKQIPDITKSLSSSVIAEFTEKIHMLSAALAPLASELDKVGNAFSRMPGSIGKAVTATNRMHHANNNASSSYINIWARARMAYNVVRGGAHIIAQTINQSNKYIEDLNLFTASLGKYAAESKKYAETVGEVMGIDPGEFMRNQGVFMTITEGFGVASDRAYIMSKNLTQLGYDLSSFFNISFQDAMQKLTSGISGELEPLRRLGYDLSEARLKAEALALGIDQSFNSMTQAEKAQLRYHAIMTQVTTAQGDMARTLNAPANQLRILQAQFIQCARAIGNIFIPVLNAILPVAIAVVKVIRLIAETIASLFGFKLPEVDYSNLNKGMSGVGGLADNAHDADRGLGGAAKRAKELKNALLGIDELNIISPPEDTGSGGGGGAGGGGVGGLGDGFDFPLDQYDFLGDAINDKVKKIMKKLEPALEWIKKHMDDIADVVIAIGAGLLAWKVANSFMDLLRYINASKLNKFAVGFTLMITGFTLEFRGAYDLGYEGATLENILKTAIGAALGIGGSLLVFGTGPLGWIVGIGMSLVIGITGFKMGANKRAIENDIKKRFGEIVLTDEEISTLVQATLGNEWSAKIKVSLDLYADLAESRESIENQINELNKYSWKVKMGVTLNSREMNDYKALLEDYLTDINQYISDRSYAITIGVKATLGENETSEAILKSVDEINNLVNDDISRLGSELNAVMNEAFSDGILTIDEQEAIDSLTRQINDIMSVINDSKYEAKIDVLNMKYGGGMAGLSKESWDAFNSELDEVVAEMKEEAEKAINETLTQLQANVRVAKMKYDSDPNNPEYERIYREAQDAYQAYLDSKPMEASLHDIEMKAASVRFDHVTTVFGAELEKASNNMSLSAETAFSNAFINGVKNPENVYSAPIGELITGMQNHWKHEFDNLDISDAARKNLHEELAYSIPTLDEMTDVIAQAQASGNALPEAVKAGLTDANTLKAMSNDVEEQMEGISYLVGESLANSPEFYETLTKAENAGMFTNEALVDGLKANVQFVENEAGNSVSVIKDGIEVATLNMTPELIKNMEDLGVNLSEGVYNGADGEMKNQKSSWKDWALWPWNWFKDENEINSPSKLFETGAGYIIEGIIEGFRNGKSNLETSVLENIVNPIKEKFSNLWTKVKNWWTGGKLEPVECEAKVNLEKGNWSDNILDWVESYGTDSAKQNVILRRDGWNASNEWTEAFGTEVTNPVSLTRNNFRTPGKWSENFGNTVWGYVNLWRNNFKSPGSWSENFGNTVWGYMNLWRENFNNPGSWAENFGHTVWGYVNLWNDGWTSPAQWIYDHFWTAIDVTVSLVKGWYGSIRNWLGFSGGGIISDSGAFKLFAEGGVIRNGKSSFWDNVPKYGNGTSKAGMHGSVFVAGEAGPEMVGHLKGQTEVLNQSQIKLAMRSAVISGMAQFTEYWRAMLSTMVVCTNAVINAIVVTNGNTNREIAYANSYDPNSTLSQSVYEEGISRRNADRDSEYTDMQSFYTAYVEPTLKEIANDAKRQADKEEQTIVQVGDRTVYDAVIRQQKANGYTFG